MPDHGQPPRDGAADGVSDQRDIAAAPISSRVLLGGGRRLLIEHGGEVYTLQVTKQNKLLLTK